MGIKPLIRHIIDEKYSLTWKVIFWLNGIILLFLTLSPDVYHRPTFSNIDKVYHFIGFGAFAFFLALAFPRIKPLLVIGIATLLGITVEIAQHFIPYRGASYGDLLADVMGAVTAVGVIVFLRR